MKTYLRGAGSLGDMVSELYGLYRAQTRDIPAKVADALAQQRAMVSALEEMRAAPLMDCDLLEIGPGQTRMFLMATGLTNRALGVDMERTPDRLSPVAMWHIWRQNGSLRLLKTLGRHALGVERRTRAELARQLGVRPAQLATRIVEGDAHALPFPDASFDAVVSTSVFEHLDNVGVAASEVARVLRPGGVTQMITHLYTSHTGAHDMRLFLDPKALPPWAHLRAQTQTLVQPNAYLNKLRLKDYRRLFEDHWPGHKDELIIEEYPSQADLDALRRDGELAEYSDQELRASVLVTTWRKPG
jgi:SAM-dependent methyltransferase